MKVLVADDDLGSRLVAQAAVSALGHDCELAEDGDAAWERYLHYRPDVLLTDRDMPGLNGGQLCRRIREGKQEGYTYIVLITSSAARDDVLAGMQAGADDYLAKPLDPFDLQTRLLAAQRMTDLHAELSRTRAELAAQARTDPLTGLSNRRNLNNDLGLLHARSRRHARSYCLALCDIDMFKAFNDTYGHQAGDDALRAVGAALTQDARAEDGVYRYGGEEFLLVLPEQDAPGALLALERLRSAVQQAGIAHAAGTEDGVLTLSIGIAAFLPGRDVTAEQLLGEADGALYQAKKAGRNRVVLAEPPQDQPPTGT